jgi:lysozyme family protein
MDWDKIESKWTAMTRRVRGDCATGSTDKRTEPVQISGMNPPSALMSDQQPRATADALEGMPSE